MLFEPISEDPDLVQAIEDYTNHIVFAREAAATISRLPPGHPQRDVQKARIAKIFRELDPRAQKLGMSGQALFEVINAALDSRARRGRPVPNRNTSRTLMTALANANAAEITARERLGAAEQDVRDAVALVQACEAAAVAWGAKGRPA